MADTFGYDEIELGPIEFAAFKLPPRAEFTTRVADYREAVEAMTQYCVINMMNETDFYCPVVSRVALNPHTSEPFVKIQARFASEELFGWVGSLLG
ncbi:hypothetical protein [Nonomuraea sp. NPDC049684]|uniref:hypothetical protein n=1 Tax=Nonomuraea sp. NPDC049684 TaxID=3364356 RepID=UPI0037B3ACFC